MGKLSGMEATVDDNAVGTPKCIVELLEACMGAFDPTFLHGELLTPHRPSLVKDGMGAKPADPAGQTILNGELQMVAGISLVGTGQLESEMLACLAQGIRRILLVAPRSFTQKIPFCRFSKGPEAL